MGDGGGGGGNECIRLPVPGTMLDRVREGKGMINGKRRRKKNKTACSLADDDSFTQENVTRVQGYRSQMSTPGK